jgi:hypothetical protein
MTELTVRELNHQLSVAKDAVRSVAEEVTRQFQEATGYCLNGIWVEMRDATTPDDEHIRLEIREIHLGAAIGPTGGRQDFHAEPGA